MFFCFVFYIKQQQSTERTDTSSYHVNTIIYSCLLSQQNTVYSCLLSQHQCSVTNSKACRHFFCANHPGTIDTVIIIYPSKLTFKRLFSCACCTWQWILFHVGNTFCLPQHLMQMHGQTKNLKNKKAAASSVHLLGYHFEGLLHCKSWFSVLADELQQTENTACNKENASMLALIVTTVSYKWMNLSYRSNAISP